MSRDGHWINKLTWSSERTFLAWLRTSLAFASIGIAVTQLFRLNTSLQGSEEVDTSSLSLLELLVSNAEPSHKLRHVGKPLGATFLGICKFKGHRLTLLTG
jgi:hypothetical protein